MGTPCRVTPEVEGMKDLLVTRNERDMADFGVGIVNPFDD